MAANVPDWMRSCTTCSEVLDRMFAVTGFAAIREYEELTRHVVEEHPARLPDYDEGCANCREWKTTAEAPERLPLQAAPALRFCALQHRAGHLLYSAPYV